MSERPEAETTAPRPGYHTRADRRLAWLVFAFFLCVYGFTNRGKVWSSDAALRIGLTEYLVEHGRLGYPPDCLRWLKVDQGRMMWGPGHLFTLIPAVLAGKLAVVVTHGGEDLKSRKLRQFVREVGATATNVVTGAATAALFFLTGLALGFTRRVSLLATLGFGLGTIWWPYTQDAYYEVLQGTVVLAAFYFFIRYMRSGSIWHVVLSGAAIGYSLITKLPNAAMVLGIVACWWVWRRETPVESRPPLWSHIAAFVGSILPFVALQLWADWSYSGQVLESQFQKDPDFLLAYQQGNILSGAFQALFGFGYGALWYTPALLVGLIWLPALARRNRGVAVGVAVCLLLGLAIVGKTLIIMGRAWGPRYFAEVFPVLGLTFFPWIEGALVPAARLRRVMTVACFALAICLQVLATTVHMERFYDDQRRMGGAEVARFPHNFPLAQRPAELARVLQVMASGQAWGLAGRSRDAQTAASLSDRARSLNVLNYWWCLGYYERVPKPALGFGMAVLVLGAALSLRAAWRGAGEANGVATRNSLPPDPAVSQ